MKKINEDIQSGIIQFNSKYFSSNSNQISSGSTISYQVIH